MNDEIREEQTGYVCKKCRKYVPFCEHASFKHRCMNDLCWNFYDMCKECYHNEIERECNYTNLFCHKCKYLFDIKDTCMSQDGVLCNICWESEKSNSSTIKNDELLIQIKTICEEVCAGTTIDANEFFKKNWISLLEDCKNKLNKEIL